MNDSQTSSGLMTFEGHLEILRKMLFHILIVVLFLSGVVFCFKSQTFEILLAPRNSDFYTFRLIEKWMCSLGWNYHFSFSDTPLISTELSAQFMTHVTVACILGVLLASPYILYKLFVFITPALYDNEKKYSVLIAIIIYGLFIIGLLMTYYILFPISFQFLSSYQVDESVHNTITLDSYVTTFTTLAFIMGIVFQLPVIAFVAGKMDLIDAALLRKYRPYALILIMIIAAIITPPDIFTLVLVTIPIYLLYEICILILRRIGNNHM
ncbi:MAG: twin-arginine translocase subunit TatC [Muribaculaceae bacterium]|nr:twin-arginine translocase subunit TatC [Muribaculaceae bacterium]